MRHCSLLLCALALVYGIARAEGYRTTVGDGADAIPVVVVTGTPFEMGKALGALMTREISAFMPAYMEAIQKTENGRYSDAALDKAWDATSKHVTSRYAEEMHGMAEGSGVPYDMIRRAHMVPVVGTYSCSAAAVWGEAAKNKHLYQIRNLDYAVGAHLQDFPMIAVYVPKEGVAHLNVSFAGVIGVNTGMNAEGITLSEVGDSPGRDYPYDLDGAHFMSLFRDILYDARSLEEAVARVKDAKRIKKYHYVIGDGKIPKAVKMRAYAPSLDIWNDNDPTDELAPNVLRDIVYHAEGRDPVAYAHLKTNRGAYDEDAMIQLSKAIGSLHGNLLDVVYDATALECWVAYANGPKECAYRRPFVRVRMRDYVPFSAKPEGVKVEASYSGR
jgi:isopenicillin-N N-acyltransferase like protein